MLDILRLMPFFNCQEAGIVFKNIKISEFLPSSKNVLFVHRKINMNISLRLSVEKCKRIFFSTKYPNPKEM